ncbi:GDSL esterase/lipase At5g33370-like isoform X3 [Trifolium pratense]|uniref:GDSL esterase/lipase At5g33370-like isoform X3 n=1 Tax=Trifolium pratense TaxID=57577 RepID=UPI001E695BA9|nr:GDSL esterase/lipase At5g33370-like isoform X3 [Trifolium pratense]
MTSSLALDCCFIVVITTFLMAFGFGSAQPTRAFFVFGDSIADNGNNHFLATTARADNPPYGIDFPSHKATGRFSNGLNIPDLISERLGLEAPLPYLNPLLIGEKLLVGANFASAGIGILNDTGFQFLDILHIDKQLKLFDHYQQRLSAHIGAEETKKLVNKALVLIILGGNDFVNNYYLVPFSARSRQFSLPDYVTYLISEYKKILRKLYNLGARKVLVTGTGPMGCVPAELALRSRNGDCDLELERAASLYNPQLIEMVKVLNREIGVDVFIAVNAHRMHMDFITNPAAFGFITSKVACCGQGPYNGIGLCTPLSNLCQNRDLYAFWDPFHPSEKASKIIVQQILTGSNEYMHPMNLSTVLAMD